MMMISLVLIKVHRKAAVLVKIDSVVIDYSIVIWSFVSYFSICFIKFYYYLPIILRLQII